MKLNEQNISNELKFLNSQLKKIRKQRSDKGADRINYSTQYSNKQFISYLKRANSKGFGFELTEKHFDELVDASCYYCDGTPSGFDRLDSKRGYLLNNVVPCCYRCNMMKHTMSVDDFSAHIFQVSKILKERIKCERK
jgi:hypothetical protein